MWHHDLSLVVMWPRKLSSTASCWFSRSWQTFIQCSFCYLMSILGTHLMLTLQYSNITTVVSSALKPIFNAVPWSQFADSDIWGDREEEPDGLLAAFRSSWGEWRSSTELCFLVTVAGHEGMAWSCAGEGLVGNEGQVLHWRVVRHWNGLPRAVVTAPGCWSSNKCLDSALRHRVWILGGPVWIQELVSVILGGPFQPSNMEYSIVLCLSGFLLLLLWILCVCLLWLNLNSLLRNLESTWSTLI